MVDVGGLFVPPRFNLKQASVVVSLEGVGRLPCGLYALGGGDSYRCEDEQNQPVKLCASHHFLAFKFQNHEGVAHALPRASASIGTRWGPSDFRGGPTASVGKPAARRALPAR